MTLPPCPISTSSRSRVGATRERRPIYADLMPPCNSGCPAGENIQSWLGLEMEGKHEEAWQAIVVDNPLPAIHGRVCYHPCESACNRASSTALCRFTPSSGSSGTSLSKKAGS